jgi:hypothetical protein
MIVCIYQSISELKAHDHPALAVLEPIACLLGRNVRKVWKRGSIRFVHYVRPRRRHVPKHMG